MGLYVDHLNSGGNEYDLLGAECYEGVDLTEKFADEIAGYSDEWAWIKARIQAGNFSKLHVGDYIPFEFDLPAVTPNTAPRHISNKAIIMGINTYKDFNPTGLSSEKVGYHIDFITEKSWPESLNWGYVADFSAGTNNGLKRQETITGDGETTEFTLNTPFPEVFQPYGYRVVEYDPVAQKLTITRSNGQPIPASTSVTITWGAWACPWFASNLYLFFNSLVGGVRRTNTVDAELVRVDYSQGGAFYYLPAALKSAIVPKIMTLATRASATEFLTEDDAVELSTHVLGNLWLPTETEVRGYPAWGGKRDVSYNMQYPYFAHRMGRRSNGYGLYTVTMKDGSNTGLINAAAYLSNTSAGSSVSTRFCFRVA